MRRPIVAFATAVVALVATPSLALAAPRPGNHPGSGTAACTVSGTTVNATGLPTDEVINFLVTDAGATHGWVLGFTSDGTWTVSVPPASGPTTYQFVSKTWGPSGSKYTVFASCS